MNPTTLVNDFYDLGKLDQASNLPSFGLADFGFLGGVIYGVLFGLGIRWIELVLRWLFRNTRLLAIGAVGSISLECAFSMEATPTTFADAVRGVILIAVLGAVLKYVLHGGARVKQGAVVLVVDQAILAGAIANAAGPRACRRANAAASRQSCQPSPAISRRQPWSHRADSETLTKLNGCRKRFRATPMTKSDFNYGDVRGFDTPTDLPATAEEAVRWQSANRSVWENNPMRYDWKQDIAPAEFSAAFYHEIDERFLTEARKFMPWKKIPFDALIDFDAIGKQDVLEIGVGCGTHAQLLASHARSFTGIDLTSYAVRCTSARMQLNGLNARIQQMDAEKMEFADNSFDFIWSWGVIHHSANTRQILQEMNRVLRPGGSATIMVYYRSFWHYYILAGIFHGLVRGQLFREKSLHRVLQQNTDGAIARYYKISDWREEIGNLFSIEKLQIYGAKAELFPLPGGKVKALAMFVVPNVVSRFFTNTLRCGHFLVAKMKVVKESATGSED